jgi:hypothetical protein
MKVTIGFDGLKMSWQADFPETTPCVHPGCKGEARIGFVCHEGMEEELHHDEYVCAMHDNEPDGEGYWLHDCCAVALYFCRKCLRPTALYNQG